MGENYFKNKEENIKNAKEHLNTIKSNKKLYWKLNLES